MAICKTLQDFASFYCHLQDSKVTPLKKKMLVVMFSTQKFREYILGKTNLVQTDHEPRRIDTTQAYGNSIVKIAGNDTESEWL